MHYMHSVSSTGPHNCTEYVFQVYTHVKAISVEVYQFANEDSTYTSIYCIQVQCTILHGMLCIV